MTLCYSFTPINECEARAVLSWRYPGIPGLYIPNPDHIDEDLAALLNPGYHYHMVRDASGGVVGFCCFGKDAQVPGGDYALPALDIGLGLHPNLVGKGLSHSFLRAILSWAHEHFQPDYFRATVAAHNVRSQGMFARAGFVITQRFCSQVDGVTEFLVLIRVANDTWQ